MDKENFDPDLAKTREFNSAELRRASIQQHELGSIGPYELVGILGKGGTSIVYHAKDPDGKDTALKVFIEINKDSRKIQRIEREIEVVSMLRGHKNIISVYNTGQVEEYYYIAMEMIPGGRTLSDYLREEDVSRRVAMRIAIEVCKALRYAHNHDVIHRDIKTRNILINEDGHALLSDFGLVRIEHSELTLDGEIMGTPIYLAPEQISDGSQFATKLSDIYSMGFVLYQIFTGEKPYPLTDGMGIAEVIDLIREHEPVKPSAIGKPLGVKLEAIILKALEKDPEDRYQSMDALLHDLEAESHGGKVNAQLPTAASFFERWVRHHYKMSMLMATIFIIVTVCIVINRKDREGDSARAMEYALEQASEQSYDQVEKTKKKIIAINELMKDARSQFEKGAYVDAKDIYRKSIIMAREIKNDELISLNQRYLCRIQIFQKFYKIAEHDLKELALDYPGTDFAFITEIDLAAALWLKGDKASAKECLEKTVLSDLSSSKYDVPILYIKKLSAYMLNPTIS
ncbi:MAG: serine/threonine protein kinase, partial [Lentisphaeria bacterium]|nr:serine/threonine protein kinase [Lentisphaeria bacterium]NQZ70290.1 serine/threonine protein kinase [Lentisphaeria bacterium]